MESVVVAGNGEKEKNVTQMNPPESDLMEKDRTGVVKFFNRVRGWGIIIQDLEDLDAFFHFSWIASDKKFKKLEDEDLVIYDLYKIKNVSKKSKKKWQAKNVRKIRDTLFD